MNILEKYQKENPANYIFLYWDQLWRQLQSSNEPALWDVSPSQGIALDYEFFKNDFRPQLSVVDIGCGNGIQTSFLTQYYDSVIGIDASKKAIDLAEKRNSIKGLSFELLNLLKNDEIDAFCEKCGDVNIYMRGVLHQIPHSHRATFIFNLKRMLGKKGTLYLIETTPEIQKFIRSLSSRFSDLPLSLRRVLTSHFPPIGVSHSEIRNFFDSGTYAILDSGSSVLRTNIQLRKEEYVELPAIYALIKPKI